MTKALNRLRTNVAIAGMLVSSVALATAASAQVATGEPSTTAPSTDTPAADDGEGLREIIVTGTKLGAQSLQRTPTAVSVVDSKLLQDQGLNTVQDIANYVPNLTFSRNTNQAVIYIRGIGSTNAGAGSDPSVTQQVDGVYIARATAQIGDFLDVDRIEVLRGPQGTLYGRNSVGGTINIISRQPSSTFGGRVRVGYGNYDAKTAEAYLTGPVAGDVLTASVAGTYRDHGAFFNNVVPGVSDVGAAKRAGVRGQLRYAPSSDFDAVLRGDYSLVRDRLESYDHLLVGALFNAPLANALVGSKRDVAINTAQPARVDTGGGSLDLNYRFGDGFALKSITAYRKVKAVYNNDNDGTDVYVQALHVVEQQRQFSQEFNLNYTSDTFKGVAGLYYFGDRDFQSNTATIPPSIATPAAASSQPVAAPLVRTRSYAAFAQGNYEIVPDLRLTAGIRYTTEKKTIDQNYARTSLNPATFGANSPGFPAIFSTRRKDHAFTPKAGIDFQATPDVLLYGSVTRGFKSGGFNNAAVSAATAGFAPEKIWAYEAGAKTQFLDRKLRVNLTGFIYDYTDLQVRHFIGPGQAVISNAATARIKGIELETLAKPVPDVQLSANVSYLDAKYRNFTTAAISTGYTRFIAATTGVGTYDASGKRLEATPRWSGVFGADFTPAVGDGYRLDIHVDYTWRGDVYFDASNIALSRQKGYGLIDANIGFGPQTGWKVEAFIKNAANRRFYQVIGGNGIVPGAIVGDPRTYGVRLGYTF